MEMDLAIAESYLAGHFRNFQDIAGHVGCSVGRISAHLRQPIAAAWILKHAEHLMRGKISLIDASMFSRAMQGDVSAAKLFYERYDKSFKTRHNVNTNIDLDFNPKATTDEELEARIMAAMKAADGAGAKVIDVTPEEEPADGS